MAGTTFRLLACLACLNLPIPSTASPTPSSSISPSSYSSNSSFSFNSFNTTRIATSKSGSKSSSSGRPLSLPSLSSNGHSAPSKPTVAVTPSATSTSMSVYNIAALSIPVTSMSPVASAAAQDIVFLGGAMQSIASKAKTNTDILVVGVAKTNFLNEIENTQTKLKDLFVNFGGKNLDPPKSCSSGGLFGILLKIACAIAPVLNLNTVLNGVNPVMSDVEKAATEVESAQKDLEKEEKKDEDEEKSSSDESQSSSSQSSSSHSSSSHSSSSYPSSSRSSSSTSSGSVTQYNIFPTASSQKQSDAKSMSDKLKQIAGVKTVKQVDWTNDDGSFHFVLGANLSPQQVASLTPDNHDYVIQQSCDSKCLKIDSSIKSTPTARKRWVTRRGLKDLTLSPEQKEIDPRDDDLWTRSIDQEKATLEKRGPAAQKVRVPNELVFLSGMFFNNFDSIPKNYYFDDTAGSVGMLYLLTWGANIKLDKVFPITAGTFSKVEFLFTDTVVISNKPNYDDATGTCLLDKIRGLGNGVAKRAPVTIVQLNPNAPDWGLLVGLQTVLSDVKKGRNTPRGKPLTVVIPFNIDDGDWTSTARQQFRDDITELLDEIKVWGDITVVAGGSITHEDGTSESDGFPLGVPAAIAHKIDSVVTVGGLTQEGDYAQSYSADSKEWIDIWIPSEDLTCITPAGANDQVSGTAFGAAMVGGLLHYLQSLPTGPKGTSEKHYGDTASIVIPYLKDLSYSRGTVGHSDTGAELPKAAYNGIWSDAACSHSKKKHKRQDLGPDIAVADFCSTKSSMQSALATLVPPSLGGIGIVPIARGSAAPLSTSSPSPRLTSSSPRLTSSSPRLTSSSPQSTSSSPRPSSTGYTGIVPGQGGYSPCVEYIAQDQGYGPGVPNYCFCPNGVLGPMLTSSADSKPTSDCDYSTMPPDSWKPTTTPGYKPPPSSAPPPAPSPIAPVSPPATPSPANADLALLVYTQSFNGNWKGYVYDITPKQNAAGAGPTPDPCDNPTPPGDINWPINAPAGAKDFNLISPDPGFTSHKTFIKCKYTALHYHDAGVLQCDGWAKAVECAQPLVHGYSCPGNVGGDGMGLGGAMTPWAYCAWHS